MPFAEVIDWSVALLPVLVMMGLFIWLDAFKLMTVREVVLLLLLGGLSAIAAYPISGRMLDTLPIGFSTYSRFVAPWIEEALKGLVVIGLFRMNRIGFKLDAVISGFAIGAGFSVVENVIYLTRFPEYGAGVWMVRGVGTAVMHGTTLAILAAIAHELAERETRGAAKDFNFNLLWFVPGFAIGVGLHMAFNQFPDRPLLAMLGAIMIAPLSMMAIFHFGTAEAQQWLATERDAHKAELEALSAGRWPESESGRRIAALAARADAATADRIRRYWELQTWLVVEAEQALLQEASGDATIDRERVQGAFAELGQLKQALGRSTFAALGPLLPFSRNDYWEVSELRQRASRGS
jgi:RsiW-degrading membrane proteinase PrsW (M82 family)